MAQKINFQQISTEFKINHKYIYCNVAGIAPLHNSTYLGLQNFWKDYQENIYLSEQYNFFEIKKSILHELSLFLKIKSEDLLLIHNTAEGINILSQGIKLKKGERILLSNGDYPSNWYPWLHWQSKGISIDTFENKNISNSKLFIQNIEQKITPLTKILSISPVHWITGECIPLEEVQILCNKYHIQLFLDGAQAVGHIPIDTTNVTAMVFPTWKWLLGPIGLGIMYIHPDYVPQVHPTFVGNDSFSTIGNYFPYQSEYKNNIEKLQCSTPNFADWVHLYYTIKFLNTLTASNIYSRIRYLGNFFEKCLQKNKEIRTYQTSIGIKSILIDDDKTLYQAHQKLEKNNIISTARNNHLRLSFHIHNTEEQIEKVADLLNKIL